MNERPFLFAAVVATLLLVPSMASAQLALTPEMALESALRNNPSARAARAELERAGLLVVREDYRYVPIVSADAGYQFGQRPVLGLSGTRLVRSNSIVGNVGIAHTLPVGTQVGASFGVGRSVRDTAELGDLGAAYDTGFELEVSQPLLRGFGVDVVRSQYRLAQASERAAVAQHQARLSGLARDVLMAYWSLWSAQRDIEIQLDALEVARRELSDAEIRLDAGVLAPAELVPIRIEIARVEEQIVSARSSVERARVTLAELAGYDDGAPLFAAVDAPPEVVLPTLAEATAAVESSAFVLAQLEADVESAQIAATLARNDAKPRLDAIGSVGVAGLGSTLGESFEQLGGFEGVVAFAGMRLELPVVNKAARAEVERADLAVEIAKADTDSAMRELRARVSGLLVDAASIRERLELARRTAELTRENVEAQSARFDAGKATTFEVITALQSAREAESRVVSLQVELAQRELELRDIMGRLSF